MADGENGVRFRSDFGVTLAQSSGGDREIAYGAWAKSLSEPDTRDNPEGYARVIGACMKGRHNTPFEHGLMSVYIEAPGVVWWQLTRQRFMSLDSEDFSLSLESGRYKHLEPEFYLPPKERPCAEPDGFKPMRPQLSAGDSSRHLLCLGVQAAATKTWDGYQALLESGVAREVARLVLPNWALYCDGYVTGKPLTWLQFLSKRNRTSDTSVPTFPMYEIEQVAAQCEDLFAGLFPVTYAAFVANGRQAP